MAIRIQPLEIEVPEDNPFQYDLLGRRDAAEVLTRIVRNIEGPCVLAIDAEWGAGKTTFLRMWSQHLHSQGFPIVSFNAWETDFAVDPLVALISELSKALGEDDSGTLKETAKEIVLRSAPHLLKLIPLVGDSGASIAREAIDFLRDDGLTDYEVVGSKIEDFKSTLGGAARKLSGAKDGRPLVVIIDELDRCRPSYAVELLEVAKHLFMVDHIVFVLAVNRGQLEHSIRALYGARFDAAVYLQRFFDQDFHLPDPERKQFVDGLLSSMRLDQYFEPHQRRMDGQIINAGIGALREFLMLPSRSLREAHQTTRRLELMLSQFDATTPAVAVTSIVALILRTINHEMYLRFLKGNVSDEEVASAIFGDPAMDAIRLTSQGQAIESAIVVASQLDDSLRQDFEMASSPLLHKYREQPENEHAQRVLDEARDMWRGRQYNVGISGFRIAIQRLELLSADLVRR